jgi:hypothetical protein
MLLSTIATSEAHYSNSCDASLYALVLHIKSVLLESELSAWASLHIQNEVFELNIYFL